MIKFNLNMEIIFEKENYFSFSYEDAEKYLLEKVNNHIKNDMVEIKNPKVTSSLESY